MPGSGGAAARTKARWLCALLAVLPLLTAAAEAPGRYRAVFNFGDSLVDAGNLVTEGIPDYLATARLPYGQTYFGYPTGRCSDGRLVVVEPGGRTRPGCRRSGRSSGPRGWWCCAGCGGGGGPEADRVGP